MNDEVQIKHTSNPSPEAEDLFQRGMAVDSGFVLSEPNKIRSDLQGMQVDNAEARRLYALAAELGHPKAMNNLSVKLLERTNPTVEAYETALEMYLRLAEMGEYRGFLGMGGIVAFGHPGRPPKEMEGTACIERAAILAGNDDLRPSIMLASMDLNTPNAMIRATPKPKPRIDRGLKLLENAIKQGNPDGLTEIIRYYDFHMGDTKKAEYFARMGLEKGMVNSPIFLEGYYRMGNFGTPDLNMSACVKALSKEQLIEIETLCPRPDGPLTRKNVGLPPAPKEPLDVTKYLQKFRLLHPDL